jgi:exoribonuclease R
MARADGLAGQVARAVVDLAEAVALVGREGEKFEAVVTDTDQRGARIQICSPSVVTRLKADGLLPGEELAVRLDSSDPVTRTVHFSTVS